MPCPWSSFAQTQVVRVEYAVVCMNIFGLLQSVRKRFASMKERGMAKVIEFYVPTIFRKPLKGTSPQQHAKVIEFCRQARKSA
jgi:hypothetical protein